MFIYLYVQIENKLQEVGEIHQQDIFSASIPLVEHFALVLERRSGHSHGLRAGGVKKDKIFMQRLRLHRGMLIF